MAAASASSPATAQKRRTVFVTSEPNELTAVWASPRCSAGVDLTNTLLQFAQELKGTTQHVTTLSLGHSRAAKAEELVVKALSKAEQWVFLQNCHLAASFMPKLCTIVES